MATLTKEKGPEPKLKFLPEKEERQSFTKTIMVFINFRSRNLQLLERKLFKI